MQQNEPTTMNSEDKSLMEGVCEIISALQETTDQSSKEVAVAALGW